ncbi:hypothetical protein [Chitinophaga pinensis]|uniref:Uncharacterized protein n=1 Tax=Chitinophaga pinensis TaxID=79329 RepID=A0A5C6LJS7_9BACT|nr:hypothetical protein [Chitinophaga pinensis]TWV94699.1 hypothetical protein FEF09_25285 [Chitinophaga pinensis]
MNKFKEITDTVTAEIENGTDYSLIEQLENTAGSKISSEKALRNYIVFLLVLIEKSKYTETASAVLIDKIYKDKIGYDAVDKSKEKYGAIFIETIKDGAVFPYVNTSFFLQKLFRSIIYGRGNTEEQNITSITPHKKLLEANEYLLVQHLNEKGIDDEAINIYCNSFLDIDVTVKLDPDANKIMRDKILGQGQFKEPDLISYLKIFIRPLYSYPSGMTERVPFYVPEPFYTQTFGTHDRLIEILETEINRPNYSVEERNLIIDIIAFLNKYQSTRDRIDTHKYVKLKTNTMASKLHKHL